MNPLTPVLNSGYTRPTSASLEALSADMRTLDAKFEATPKSWPKASLTRQAHDLAGQLALAGAGIVGIRDDLDGRVVAAEMITASSQLFEGIGRADAMRDQAHVEFGDRVGYGGLMDDAISAAESAARFLASSD